MGSSLVLDLEQWLFGLANDDVVLCLVVVKDVGLFSTGKLFCQVLVNDVLNLVVSSISVVDLNDLVDERILYDVSFIFSVSLLIFLVQVVDILQYCLVSYNFLCTVHSEEDSLFQHYEVCLEA